MSQADQFFDAEIRHQVRLQRLGSHNVQQILALLRKAEADVVQRLTMGDLVSGQRLEAYLQTLRAIIDSAYRDASGKLNIDLQALAEYEVEFQADLFADSLQEQTVRPTSGQVWAAVYARPFQGKLLSDVWPELSEAAWRRVRDTIRIGFLEGQTLDQIIGRIRGTRAQGYKDGIFEVSRRDAEAVVRTATSHTANVAKDVFYQANSRLIRAVEWVSVLDHRTSAVCRGRSGQIYPLDSGPRPPAHWRCRSTTVSVLRSSFPDNSGEDGRVAADVTYSQWLRRQSAAFQDELLGKTKAKLFRDGGLDLDRFINRAGDELTLDQLREREKAAWKKAGL